MWTVNESSWANLYGHNIGFLECGTNWTGPVLGKDSVIPPDSQVAGYICCFIAGFIFGGNFVPFRFVQTGDGIFTQWVMCASIFVCGLITQLARGQPIFYPATLMGGIFWTFGNATVVPCTNLIGLSLGMLIWNTSTILIGWAPSRFGWLGLCPNVPNDEIMNYIGVTLCTLAGPVYALIKTETDFVLPQCLKKFNISAPPDTNDIGNGAMELQSKDADNQVPQVEVVVFMPNLPKSRRRILGVALAVFAGICYAFEFVDVTYIQNHTTINGARASQNGLDYVFSQFCGIFLMSTVMLVVYVLIYRRTAYIDKQVILPAIVSGVLWCIATISFFIANSALSPAITFPIIITLPGVIGALWGIFLFREIRGLRNFMLLGAASCLTFSGAILTALSQ